MCPVLTVLTLSLPLKYSVDQRLENFFSRFWQCLYLLPSPCHLHPPAVQSFFLTPKSYIFFPLVGSQLTGISSCFRAAAAAAASTSTPSSSSLGHHARQLCCLLNRSQNKHVTQPEGKCPLVLQKSLCLQRVIEKYLKVTLKIVFKPKS